MAIYKTLPYITGKNLAGIICDQNTGQYWNTSTGGFFENFTNANVAQYGITMTEQGSSSNYTFQMPWNGNFKSGLYTVYAYIQTASGGTALQISDLANGPVVVESGIAWNAVGSHGLELSLASMGGIFVTGTVQSSPTPTATTFTVLLDGECNASGSDYTTPPLYVTFKSGNREGLYAKITGCTVTNPSTTQLALTVFPTLPGAPAGGDLVLISG